MRFVDHTQTHHVIGPSQGPLPTQNATLTRDRPHASGGIQTRNPSKRAASVPFLRPRGHWARRKCRYCIL